MTNERKSELFGNALKAIEYHMDGLWEDLYKTLSERVGMTDEEIYSLGYDDLCGCMPPDSIIEVKTDRDILITFADGKVYSVLEGITPSWMEKDQEECSSDICFVMDVTNAENWELVDWFFGITSYEIEDMKEVCQAIHRRKREKNKAGE